MTEENEQFYSVEHVAKELDVSVPTITRWIRQGLFSGAKKKGPFRNSPYIIPQSAIDQMKDQLDAT